MFANPKKPVADLTLTSVLLTAAITAADFSGLCEFTRGSNERDNDAITRKSNEPTQPIPYSTELNQSLRVAAVPKLESTPK